MPTRSPAFVHLQVHSHYSLLEGCVRIPDLVEAAIAADMSAVALTDTDGLWGAIEFYRRAEARGIKPIIGCELNWPMADERGGALSPAGGEDRVVLLAETTRGYRHLMRWVTAAQGAAAGGTPRTDLAQASEWGGEIIALAGHPDGALARMLLNGDLDGALRYVTPRRAAFGPDHFFLMVQDHGTPRDRRLRAAMALLSEHSGIPRVATQDVHYLDRRQAPAQDVLACLRQHRTLADTHRHRLATPEYDFKSGAAMAALFPGEEALLERAAEIAGRCEFDPELGRLEFAQYPRPPGRDLHTALWAACRAGLTARLGVTNPDQPATELERAWVSRCRQEVAVIEKTRFVNYFLVTADVVAQARARGIAVGPGRGTGVGSLVAFLLGITDIEPLRYGLWFERFLNPERVEPPLFDIDFCHRRRGEVIAAARQRYGEDRVAPMMSHSSFGARTAVRDVARVLDLPPAEAERLIRRTPESDDPAMNLGRAWEAQPDFREAFGTGIGRRVYDYARGLEGLHRSAGVHASGVVMSARPLTDRTPLQRDAEGHWVTQYDGESLKALGLLKIDVLGSKILTVVDDAVREASAIGGVPAMCEQPATDDPATYARLRRGETQGLFHLESAGLREGLIRIGVADFTELTVAIALNRSGRFALRDAYWARRTGENPVRYDHPLLEPILRETRGLWIFQEQFLGVGQGLAGFTPGHADLFRRALEGRDPAAIETERERFVAGCRRTHHLSRAIAGEIFDALIPAAASAFSKAHGVALAWMAYRTAWLMQHHPQAYLAALMTGEPAPPDKMAGYVHEARRRGIEVRGPDVNRSDWKCRAEGVNIRFGLAGIRQVGEAAARSIVEARAKAGPFVDLTDFIRRWTIHPAPRRMLENLILSGALDSLGGHRAQWMRAVESALAWMGARSRERKTGQETFFERIGIDPEVPTGWSLPEVTPWPAERLRQGERETLGFELTPG